MKIAMWKKEKGKKLTVDFLRCLKNPKKQKGVPINHSPTSRGEIGGLGTAMNIQKMCLTLRQRRRGVSRPTGTTIQQTIVEIATVGFHSPSRPILFTYFSLAISNSFNGK